MRLRPETQAAIEAARVAGRILDRHFGRVRGVRLKGPKDVADSLYEGVETWEVEPWFARDPW